MLALNYVKKSSDMKFIGLVFRGILLQIFLFSPALSQQFTDSTRYIENIRSLHKIYLDAISDNAQIYHGIEYIRNGRKVMGFPFFESENMLSGNVIYQGNLYSDIELYYDLVSDALVIKNYAKNSLVTLSPDKIDSFQIGNHIFYPLAIQSSNGSTGQNSYYEQLLPGNPGFFVKRTKVLFVPSGADDIKYVQYDNYFIRLNNVYYKIEGENALLEVLKDREDALKKYIRSNKLNFKKRPESSMVLTTKYYSLLKH